MESGKIVTVVRMNGDFFCVVEGKLTLRQKSQWCVAYDCSDSTQRGRKKVNVMSFQEVPLWANDTDPGPIDPLIEVDYSAGVPVY